MRVRAPGPTAAPRTGWVSILVVALLAAGASQAAPGPRAPGAYPKPSVSKTLAAPRPSAPAVTHLRASTPPSMRPGLVRPPQASIRRSAAVGTRNDSPRTGAAPGPSGTGLAPVQSGATSLQSLVGGNGWWVPRPATSQKAPAWPPELAAYDPLSINYDRIKDPDPRLMKLIAALRAAVAGNEIAPVAAALADDLVIVDCDNDATRPCAAPNRPPHPSPVARLHPDERLLQSVCCADMRPRDVPGRFRVDAVLDLLGTVIERDGLGSDPDLPGAVCLPSPLVFDRATAVKMAIAASTDPQNLRVASKEIIVRKGPADGAPEIARVAPRQIVPMVADLANPVPDGWSAIALPQGILGYASTHGLDDLVVGSACFKKNANGIWQLFALIRRHPWGGPG